MRAGHLLLSMGLDGQGAELRGRLGRARLMLLFTPGLCAGRDPLEVLEAALPFVDVVQVRPKAPDVGLDDVGGAPARATTEARELADWTVRVLELVRSAGADCLVIANDRVDVARTLQGHGCHGVHLGQEDAPPALARELLGPDALIGLSTHDNVQVVLGGEQPVDYLGFGPVHATSTKGYRRGLGPEAAWIAHEAAGLPLFPIGGIDLANVSELERIGRAAVSSAILSAEDPGAVARTLRALLEG